METHYEKGSQIIGKIQQLESKKDTPDWSERDAADIAALNIELFRLAAEVNGIDPDIVDDIMEDENPRVPVPEGEPQLTREQSGRLFGLLLGYPLCCIEAHCNHRSSSVSHVGFMPCEPCSDLSREEIEARIGRSLDSPPPAFDRWIDTHEGIAYLQGLGVYEEFGEAGFFRRCWDLKDAPVFGRTEGGA